MVYHMSSIDYRNSELYLTNKGETTREHKSLANQERSRKTNIWSSVVKHVVSIIDYSLLSTLCLRTINFQFVCFRN